MKERFIFIVIIFALLVFGVYECQNNGDLHNQNKNLAKKVYHKIDTVTVHHFHEVQVAKENVTKPDKVTISKTKNLAKRKAIEKQPEIIEGFTLGNDELNIQKIDSAGNEVELAYLLGDSDEVKADSAAKVEVTQDPKAEKKAERKKKFNRFLTKAGAVIIFSIGLYLGSHL